MSSHSSDCIEIRSVAPDSSSLVDLEQLAQELSPITSEYMLPSEDRGVCIPELGRKIQSVSQLTPK